MFVHPRSLTDSCTLGDCQLEGRAASGRPMHFVAKDSVAVPTNARPCECQSRQRPNQKALGCRVYRFSRTLAAKRDAIRTYLCRPPSGDDAFALDCRSAWYPPFCRLETPEARQTLGGVQDQASSMSGSTFPEAGFKLAGLPRIAP